MTTRLLVVVLGIFDMFKKKEALELPEPPAPPQGSQLVGDLPSIRGSDISEQEDNNQEFFMPSAPQSQTSTAPESTPASTVPAVIQQSQSQNIPNSPVAEIKSKMKSRPVGPLYAKIYTTK